MEKCYKTRTAIAEFKSCAPPQQRDTGLFLWTLEYLSVFVCVCGSVSAVPLLFGALVTRGLVWTVAETSVLRSYCAAFSPPQPLCFGPRAVSPRRTSPSTWATCHVCSGPQPALLQPQLVTALPLALGLLLTFLCPQLVLLQAQR